MTEAGLCTEPQQVPVRASIGVHPPRFHIQHQGDDCLITQGQGKGNKGLSFQGHLIVYVLGFNESAGASNIWKCCSTP